LEQSGLLSIELSDGVEKPHETGVKTGKSNLVIHEVVALVGADETF
jgi:hypothetical protein